MYVYTIATHHHIEKRFRSVIRFEKHIFFFNDTATTEIYTLSLHDALPIFDQRPEHQPADPPEPVDPDLHGCHRKKLLRSGRADRKSTRLNSSHANISYAVFCLKKKKTIKTVSSSVHTTGLHPSSYLLSLFY